MFKKKIKKIEIHVESVWKSRRKSVEEKESGGELGIVKSRVLFTAN
jgi:hypothetical protein